MFRLVLSLAVLLPMSYGRQKSGTCEICDCSVNGVVDCSNRNLSHIPSDLNASTVTLNMSSNFLQCIENGIFKNLTNLKILDLFNTSLKNVTGDAFAGLESLIVLNISQNDQLPLTNVSTPADLFNYTTLLQVLSMYGTTGTYNKCNGYPDKQLSKLKYLRELWTDGLTDMEFGPEFRNMSSLKTLRLAGDIIEPSWRSKEFCNTNLLDGMLDNLVSVTHLYIRKCGVLSVDENAFQKLENLEYLDLSDNKVLNLSNLFDSFCSLSNKTTSLILNKIAPRVRDNCGTKISTNMVRCLKNKSIRELQLNHNRIQYIDSKALMSLPKTLQIVRAAKNEFYLGLYIFDVSTMTNLTKLDVSYQFFTDDLSVWHKKNDDQSELMDNFSGNVSGNNPYQTDISESKGNQESRYKHHLRKDHDDELAGVQGGHEFQGFVERLITSISYQNPFNYKLNEGENNNTKLVCPQLNNDRYIPPGTIIGKIPPKMKYLDLSHSKHANPIFEMFINESNSLKTLNVSNSLLYCWEGPVHGLNKLEKLDLSVNFCTNISSNFFQKVSTLKKLNISFNILGNCIAKDVEGKILSNLTALEYLDISFNTILDIPKLFLQSQSKMRKLYAHSNLLEVFNVDISHMTQLQRLDLRMNRIGWLYESTCDALNTIADLTSKNTTRSLQVDLRNNSIHCSCKNIYFIKWVYEHFNANTSLNVSISHCIFYENRSLVIVNSREILGTMVEHLESQCRSYTALIIGLSLTLALVINVMLGVLVHRFRWKLQYWYYVVLGNRCTRSTRRDYEPVDEPQYLFDVFVASSDDRKEFVIDKLRPVFRENELTAFIPVYHMNVNESLVNTIGKAINKSRVILFILSDEWSSDDIMNVAVHMWQCDMVKREELAVLGIFLNNLRGADAEKVTQLYCNTFIDYPEDGGRDAETAFWTDCVQNVRGLIRQN